MTASDGAGTKTVPADKLAEVIEALRDIYRGSSVTGRWYCEDHRQAVGHDPVEPDEGYYDRDHPPPGYDAKGLLSNDDESADPAENLIPSEWEEYTIEEQSRWLRTCATIAKDTLEKLGIRVVDPGGVP
jgi:hypothetical protein